GVAENGLHAIELADELDPDAVVIDLHMPLVDGVTAVARLRKDHPRVFLIALTGDPDRELHEAVTEAGADAVLEKSALVDTLVGRGDGKRKCANCGTVAETRSGTLGGWRNRFWPSLALRSNGRERLYEHDGRHVPGVDPGAAVPVCRARDDARTRHDGRHDDL